MYMYVRSGGASVRLGEGEANLSGAQRTAKFLPDQIFVRHVQWTATAN